MSELEEQGGPVIGSPGGAQDLMAALMRDTVPLPTPGLLFQHSIGAAIMAESRPDALERATAPNGHSPTAAVADRVGNPASSSSRPFAAPQFSS